MQKLCSLIKANLSEGMTIFKINTKKKSKATQILVPVFLSLTLMSMMGMYAQGFMEQLAPLHLEFVVLTLFIVIVSLLTLIEGIYKAGGLLFNCKDDNLLLSLPLHKRTILFLRVFKFYLFELIYNSLFLVPSMIVYAFYVHPGISFYLLSILGLLLFPIVPIVLSCFLGAITTYISSKFKGKNFVQIVLSILLIMGIWYTSYSMDNFYSSFASKAKSINEMITRIYYPAGAYINLITNLKFLDLLLFIGIHILLFSIAVLFLGRVYLKISSSTRSIKVKKSNKKAIIRTSSVTQSFIKKEFNRFINSPVFVINAGFGLVIFIVACIAASIKYNDLVASILAQNPELNLSFFNKYLPVIIFGLITFSSFTTMITSSMISLEGKTFNLLKSLPVEPKTIIRSKVLTAVLIMVPCFLLGEIILFINFEIDIISVLLLMIAAIILPLVAETIGILFNLKFPKMDALNDTEIIKQSMSSSGSVFFGFLVIGITGYLMAKLLMIELNPQLVLLIFTVVFGLIYGLLHFYLERNSEKLFNNIKI